MYLFKNMNFEENRARLARQHATRRRQKNEEYGTKWMQEYDFKENQAKLAKQGAVRRQKKRNEYGRKWMEEQDRKEEAAMERQRIKNEAYGRRWMQEQDFKENRAKLSKQAERRAFLKRTAFQIQDERIAFATDITRLPADPNLVYGGTIIQTRSSVVPVFITSMPAQVAPILKKQEDAQTQLLRQILGKVGGAAKMKGIPGQGRQPVDAFAQLGHARGAVRTV
jgi:hypothetical protein